MLTITALLALAQTPMFPFVIPWDDAVKGTATDVSFLNAMPAGKNGRIIVRGGHFVEAKTGTRVRFFGVNMAGRAAFPTHADADKIAAHLAKMGINIVRLHHLQNDWDLNGGTIWDEKRLHIAIDPSRLDTVAYFIDALKRKGIYTNLNLQTTRKYYPVMGFPESVLKIPTEFCKKIDKVDRRMIALQKEYAKSLLDYKSPYSGTQLKNDPALAVVEINNENSLVGGPGEPPGYGLREMPEPFRGEIVTRWNSWVKSKYRTLAALDKAWTDSQTPNGPTILTAANQWTTENQSNGDVTFAPGSEGRLVAPLQIKIRSNSGPDWHVQAHLTGLSLIEGGSYTLSFDASCTNPGQARVSATLDVSDWHNLGLERVIDLGPEVKRFKFGFSAADTKVGHNRIAFALGNLRGDVSITNVSLSPGLGGLDVTKGYDDGTIDLPEGGPRRQMSDYTEFLADTETAYSTEMRSFLRKDLGVKANLIDTQVAWGGMTHLMREAGSDFADNHAYWEHPAFKTAWSATEWTEQRRAMSSDMGIGNGTFLGLAQGRVANKPYTISEYQHPAPTDFRADNMPLLATFAAAQDWDGFYMFCYDVTGEGKVNDAIQGYFSSATDPSKVAFYPAAALIFRAGLTAPLSSSATLSVPKKVFRDMPQPFTVWNKVGMPDILANQVSVQTYAGSVPKLAYHTVPVSAKPLEAVNVRHGRVYSAQGETAVAVTGFVGGATVTRGLATFAFPEFGDNFVAVTLVPVDKKPLVKSARMLLTLVGRVENQDMVWNAARTSVSDKWGHGPTVAEGIPCAVKLRVDGPRKVFALDGNGRKLSPVSATYANGVLAFSVGSEQRTLWYEIAKR